MGPVSKRERTHHGQYPVHRERSGNITVSIWENLTDDKRAYYTVSPPTKRFQQDGEWKTTTNLNHSDILNACKALDLAHTWIEHTLEQGRENARAERPQDERRSASRQDHDFTDRVDQSRQYQRRGRG
jgi:hypothetical protein